MLQIKENPPELVNQFLNGNTYALSKMLRMTEDGDPKLTEYLPYIIPNSGKAFIIGITGPPGAGKSTLVDGVASALAEKGKEVGVLCIDPSSPFTGGAFLGDRFRMQKAAKHNNVFIRSLATRGIYGGLAPGVWESIEVLDSFGKEVIIVETVGVGQLETDIQELADLSLLVTIPGLGDFIQTLKAGLMEVGDLFIVNMADRPGTADTVKNLEIFLDKNRGGQKPPVVTTIATQGKGIAELIETIWLLKDKLSASGLLQQRRRERLRTQVKKRVQAFLNEDFENRVQKEPIFRELMLKAENRELSVTNTAYEMAKVLFKENITIRG